MSADADNIIFQQLRLIRAENEKRDRDFALLRAEFLMLRSLMVSQLEGFGSKLDVIISMLGTHTDTLYQMNVERLLVLERHPSFKLGEGEPGTE
jgi:hypothetical protein